MKNGEKTFYPLTFGRLNGKLSWHCRHPNSPRPLYNLAQLRRAKSVVVITEGEKAADAAQKLLPDFACLSFGGANMAAKVDLGPVAGRKVVIWPDADAPGRRAADELAKRLPGAWVVNTDGLPAGFDAADWTGADPRAWLRGRLRRAA